MVTLALKVKADLENLTNLQPQGGVDDPQYTYYFTLQCENCGEKSEKQTCVSLEETVPLPKKGYTNLIQKCKFCGRDGNITMVPGKGSPLTHGASEAEKAAALMLFDCRGFVPVDFSFGDGWKAESLVGTKFNDIDLSEGEFAEYDEKGKCPVMISNLSATFEDVK